ncbi:EcsC family protein [Rossellomorea sp. BNER]|uniref:EcsC family protein n=1 Tax=Rossellomorea sp. BNER TaxID=2962031 RepID=UPI003AF2ECB5|nr:EcsC family protein [Rossellomorea sp. BNER]
MNSFEITAKDELEVWKRKLLKRSGVLNRVTKKAQLKMNKIIPEKVHKVITDSIKNMVKVTLTGSKMTVNQSLKIPSTLQEKEELMKERLDVYRKTATIEGAGTGAGGIMLGLADFPLLLSIKMKYLFEASTIQGYDVKQYEERLFILHVFQLAFSSDEHRQEILSIIENWDDEVERLKDMDWRKFQQEYRDYIDFIKMLQLIPGIGAVVGAYANYQLLDQLGETAKFAYRIRYFGKRG